MRVITGLARGKRLKEPSGLETRPTTDRVKEGIFSSIQFEIEGRKVLDLFGGTGQMGIEALSRGAAHCTFVDLRKEAAAVIRGVIRQRMAELRVVCDEAENLTAEKYWPFPTYDMLLFGVK